MPAPLLIPSSSSSWRERPSEMPSESSRLHWIRYWVWAVVRVLAPLALILTVYTSHKSTCARSNTHAHTPACTHTHIHTRTHTGIGCLRTRRHIGDFRVLWRSLPIKKFVEIYFENPETSGNRCEVLSLSLSLFVTGHAQRRDGFLSPLTNERSPLLSSLV